MGKLLPALCLALAALPACGSDDDAPTRTVRVAAGEPVRVVASEYAFDPGRIVVSGGAATLSISLDNQGDLAHNITVLKDDAEVGGLSSFPGGEQRTTSLKVEPGSYRFVCTVADHEELGMDGTLEVRAGAAK